MDNISFGPTELAAAMQTSSRNMYRKFKKLNQLPPKDFIKDKKSIMQPNYYSPQL